MPIALKPSPIDTTFDSFKSVLIVPCHVCPKMCIVAEKSVPYVTIANRPSSDYYARFLSGLGNELTEKGIRSFLFGTLATLPMMCLWPARLRNRLCREMKEYDAAAVVGCESAAATVMAAAPGRPVIQVMLYSFPGNRLMEGIISRRGPKNYPDDAP